MQRRLAGFAAIAVLAAGCASSGASSAPSTAASAPASAPPAASSAASPSADATPVSFSLWAVPLYANVPGFEEVSAAAGDWERYLASEYTKAHPNVTIDVQSVDWGDVQTKVSAAVAAGSPPDVYLDASNRLVQWTNQEGLVEDLKGILPQETLDAVLPNFIDSASVDGKLAYLPIYSDPVSLKCNKALIESVGGAFPEDGVWSFGEFDAVAEKLAAAGKAAAVFRLADEQGDYDWLGYIWGHGMREFDASGKSAMGSPEGIAGIQWMADANENGWVLPGTSTISFADVDTAYYSGQLACMGGNMRHLLRANEAKEAGSVTEPFDSQLAMYPHADGLQPYGVSTFDAGYLVFSQEDEAKKQAIADFLAFATQLEYVTAEAKTGSISPFKAVGNALEGDEIVGPQAAKYVDWIANYGVLPSFQSLAQYNDIRLLRVPIMQSAVLGDISPADAAAQIDSEVNALIGQ